MIVRRLQEGYVLAAQVERPKGSPTTTCKLASFRRLAFVAGGATLEKDSLPFPSFFHGVVARLPGHQ